MKSNYKPIGDLVERVDNRNKDGAISNLLGLSIDKKFIPSVANTIGTDLSTYKIIQKNDFAVSLMQVSRDSKIPVACQKEYEAAIMSPAYSIFRVKNEDEILPDYLEMWFKRSEFDREAAFIAVGGVRGSMPWEEFAGIKVYVPNIEQQEKLVRQYKTISDRIVLKQRINDNLEAMLRILYKRFFFSDSALPCGWKKAPFSDIATIIMGQSPEGDTCNESGIGEPLLNGPTEFGFYSPTPVQWTTDAKRHCTVGDILFCVRGSTTGRMNWANKEYAIGRGLAAIHHKFDNKLNWFIKAIIDNSLKEILAAATGSTFPNVGKDLLNEFSIILPDDKVFHQFGETGNKISCLIRNHASEMDILLTLQQNLLTHISSREIII